MYKLIATTLMASVVLAGNIDAIVARQISTCEDHTGYKTCHSGCIPINYTCCPVLQGGCEPGTYCTDEGCCPIGETCSGGGGISSGTLTGTYTNTITATNTIPQTLTSTSSAEETTSSTSTSRSLIPSSTSSSSTPSSTPGGSGSTSASPSTPLHTGGASTLNIKFGAVAGLIAGGAALL
ncbi:hypothetical protein EYZ11_012053 [Aspergillus tanneri]|uniref:GPI anchored serine-threonine rich protein n=1 Tax=Aspergillus tanneri TaxID=1220188 RepID=A0A4V3UMT2_9EURO|nr:uncharacterized protein ATNIH1004_006830 [Aspergillus tanneri]KAA8645411.1 hypothetical protein ATNIH1004_006830 [Aspergillus tanneri]THC88504.1 hypothetical protein EYZ11_012053 [Aspergillus tanneri]